MLACAFHAFYIFVNVYTHCMFLNACLSGGQLASPSQRTAPGAILKVPNKSFCHFFSSRPVTVDGHPSCGPAGGLPTWAGALQAEGEGQNGILHRLCVLVGVRVCVWRTSAKVTPGANGLEKFSHCLHPLLPSPHALADVGRNYWTPWLPFLPTAAFDLFHVGQIFFPLAVPLSRPPFLFSAAPFPLAEPPLMETVCAL